jgi:hypothetical protein
MKTLKQAAVVSNRHLRLRDAYCRKLAEVGPVMEGSLCRVKRPGRRRKSWQLTWKQHGRTCTVYVPAGMAQEVQQWTSEYRKLKQLVRKITAQSLALIHLYGAARRAASRGRSPTSKRSAGNCARSRATRSRT